MRKLFFLFAVAALPFGARAQSTWVLDKSHSSVKFSVAHMVISETEGSFKIYDGKVSAPKPDFTDARINFTVDVNSINTDDAKRDAHLKSDDFFSAEKFPEMKFASTSFKKVKGNMYTLEGNLTIRDVTRKVKFAVVYGGTAKDPWGNTKAGFKASTKINRHDFGLTWTAANEAGDALVGDDVQLLLNVELAQEKA